MSTRAFRDTYEVLAKIGEGGMGAIYKVRHRHLDQERVIKIMRPQVSGDEDFEARFLREARLEAALQHPNIAQLYEFEVAPEGTAYMVMEYIEGVTLRQILDIAGPPSIEFCLFLADQGLEALAYLHRCGFVHRDVSPDNIMIAIGPERKPIVKVIDLGIAKKTEESHEQQITRTGTFIGKVQYASPEQFGTTPIDNRSDIYSFGIVLYEVLTGVYPIAGHDTNSLIGGHLFKPPVGFDESDPRGEIPEELRRILLKSLEKQREDRYLGATEFRHALLPLAAGAQPDAEAMRLIELCSGEPDLVPTGADIDIFGTEETRLRSRRMGLETEATVVHGDEPTVLLQPKRSTARLAWVAVALLLLTVAVLTYRALWVDPPVETETVADELALPLPPDLDFGNYYALVIGNDDYRFLPRLKTAVDDARAVAKVLEEDYGFAVTKLFDGTRYQIFEALEAWRTLGPEDSLLVYYAGHGALYTDDSLYWQPVDADPDSTVNWLATDDVNSALRDSKARSVLVVADSCYAGAMTEPATRRGPPPADRLTWIRERLQQSARLALTSGNFSPVADSSADGEHSVFANAFLRELRENETVLDGWQLHARLADEVQQRAAGLDVEQRPVYAPLDSAGDQGGEFFFVPTDLQTASREANS